MRALYSRLLVPNKSGDEAVLGLLLLWDPLGFETTGPDLVAFFRDPEGARGAGEALAARRIRHALTTDIPEGDPLEAYRAASRPFPVGRRLWVEPGEASPAVSRRARACAASSPSMRHTDPAAGIDSTRRRVPGTG